MKKTRIAIAQMNPTVGDYSANAKKILRWIHEAESRQADLIVFPECALSGYPVWDLANKKPFVEEGLEWLKKIVAATRGKKITAVLGYIDRSRIPAKPVLPFSADSRRPFRSQNCMGWIAGGKLLHRYAKRLLPNYDVFLENIFFDPGLESRVIPWKNSKIGPTICEDIWDFRYDQKPVEELSRQKADWMLNISASPFFSGAAGVRDQLLKRHAARSHLPMLYVNQVGAQDDLIFDGRSIFMDGKGRILFRAPAFEEGLFFFDWNPGSSPQPEAELEETSKEEEVYQALVLGIQDYCRKNNFQKVVIGLSGGIDSALVAALAADALGPEVVCGVAMPGPYSSPGSWEDAEELAERLGIQFRVYPIREKYEFLKKAYRDQRGQSEDEQILTPALENLQARLRGLELMFISNDECRLLLSTGNKSELAMGYCTLYGDMAGGLCVLGDVYKTDVYALARWRNRQKEVIPKSTLKKPPSAELRPNQKDEDSLPPYEILDEILCSSIEKNKSVHEIALLMKKKVSAETIAEVVCRVDHNEYKRRQTPPILRVTEKAWFGRRMPITNRFEI